MRGPGRDHQLRMAGPLSPRFAARCGVSPQQTGTLLSRAPANNPRQAAQYVFVLTIFSGMGTLDRVGRCDVGALSQTPHLRWETGGNAAASLSGGGFLRSLFQ